ncbi:MAG: alpha/beta hydrolase [Actinobacteria bacterium]|jgi:pimeloyl-ACP methyl ester carboxylesterase|nr:alpha/beta hydrolase [Actinomycetota bacterium]
MAQAAVNGITIEFEEYGSGDPLLLVMGLGGQLTDWPPELIEHLVAAGFRVIAPDNRDIGLSTEMSGEGLARSALVKAMLGRPVKAPYSLSDMASDAVGVLDHLGIDRAHVVGMSMGGMISQEIAIGWPDRVLSLTSIMSHTGDRRHGLAKPSLLWRITRLGDPDPSNPSSVVDNSMKIWQWISGPTYDEAVARQRIEAGVERSIRVQGTARQTAAIFASRDRTPLLASVKCPTLVVHGMVDPLVTPSGGRTTAKAVPGARLIEFPDMGHDLPTNRIPEIVEEIRRNADRA